MITINFLPTLGIGSEPMTQLMKNETLDFTSDPEIRMNCFGMTDAERAAVLDVVRAHLDSLCDRAPQPLWQGDQIIHTFKSASDWKIVTGNYPHFLPAALETKFYA